MGTIADKLNKLLDTKENIKQELFYKGYSEEQITEIFSNYPLLIRMLQVCGIDKQPQWFQDALVCWYDPAKQRATNENMKAHPVLKDFSKNGLDMQLRNFAWEGMSGMGGYTFPYSVLHLSKKSSTIEEIAQYKIHISNIKNSAFIFQITGLEKIPETKIKISGENLTSDLGFHYTDKYGTKHILSIRNTGIYTIPAHYPTEQNAEWGLNQYPAQGNCNFTIEFLPFYENALVFDGVDDYGISEGQPQLTDYTVMAKRIFFDNKKSNGFCQKCTQNRSGAFMMEISALKPIDKVGCYSFGADSINPFTNNSTITYQSKNSYNGHTIASGDGIDGDLLKIGHRTDAWYFKGALYYFLEFNRTLTPDERDYVRYVIMGEELSKPIAVWSAKNRRNDEPDGCRNILPDLSGNGHHITLHNFAFDQESGYGKYILPNFNSPYWTNQGKVQINSKYNFLITQGNSSISVMFMRYPPTSIVKHCVINIQGIDEKHPVYFRLVQDIKLHNGLNYIDIPVTTSENFYLGFFANKDIPYNVSVTMLPTEYPDALVFDGTDDYGVCENMPIFTKEKGYTNILVRESFKKASSWFISKAKSYNTGDEGAFNMEFQRDSKLAISNKNFGVTTMANNDTAENTIVYQTSKVYNGYPIEVGNSKDTTSLTLGAFVPAGNFWQGAFYEAHIFDHDLSPLEILFYTRKNIDKNYVLPNNPFDVGNAFMYDDNDVVLWDDYRSVDFK